MMQKQNNEIVKIDIQANQPSKFEQIQSEYKFIIRQVLYEKLYFQEQAFDVYVNEILQDKSNEAQIKAETQNGKSQQNFNQSVGLGDQKSQNGLMQVMSNKNIEQSDKNAIKAKNKKKKVYQQKDFYENQDKALKLASKMMRMKQEREKKHQITRQNIKKFLEKQKQQNQLKQFQSLAMTPENVNLFKRTSTQIKRGNISQLGSYYDHRYKVQNQLAFSRVRKNQETHDKNMKNYNFKKVPNMFADINSLRSQYNSLTLTPRQLRDSNTSKRNMERQVEILRKSQKISLKYEVKKFLIQFAIDLADKCVQLVQKKKQFFYNSLPLKIHQIIDKNNPAYKKYRRKLEKKKKKQQKNQERQKKQQQKKLANTFLGQNKKQNQKRNKTSRISQVFNLNIKGKQEESDQVHLNSQSDDESDESSSNQSSNDQSSQNQSSLQAKSNDSASKSQSQQTSLIDKSDNSKGNPSENQASQKQINKPLQNTYKNTKKIVQKQRQAKNKINQSRLHKQQNNQNKAVIQLHDRQKTKVQQQKTQNQQDFDVQRKTVVMTKQFKRGTRNTLSANKNQQVYNTKNKHDVPLDKNKIKIRINSEVRITQKTQVEEIQNPQQNNQTSNKIDISNKLSSQESNVQLQQILNNPSIEIASISKEQSTVKQIQPIPNHSVKQQTIEKIQTNIKKKDKQKFSESKKSQVQKKSQKKQLQVKPVKKQVRKLRNK